MSPYAPQADLNEASSLSNVHDSREECSSSEAGDLTKTTETKSDLEETISGSFDMKETIRSYVDNVMLKVSLFLHAPVVAVCGWKTSIVSIIFDHFEFIPS